MQSLNVLYEDNHLLVMNKPAGLATMGAGEQATLHSDAVEYLRKKYDKPGRVFLGIVSRLDAMTSGVIVMPRTSKSASRLTPQFAPADSTSKKKPVDRAAKVYLAAIQGKLPESTGILIDRIRKDESARRMRITKSEGLEASLRFTKIASTADTSILAVRLLTGRKHQIRVQFADRGLPVLGDRKYESAIKFGNGIALHSWRLRIEHPTKKDKIWFVAEPPKSWHSLLRQTTLDETLWLRVKDDLHIT